MHEPDIRKNLFLIVSPEIFQPVLEGKPVSLDRDSLFHIRKVLRNKGEVVVNLSSGKGDVLPAKLTENDVLEKTTEKPFYLPRKTVVSLMTPGIQRKNLELMVQKSVELGVAKIHFIRSDYENHPVDNLERYRKIAIAACIQSKNPFLPEFFIHKFSLTQFPFDPEVTYLWGDPEEKTAEGNLHEVEKIIRQANEVCFVNGPEGGWSAAELNFLKNRFRCIQLSSNVLRAETAALTAVFLIGIFGKSGEVGELNDG